MALFEVTANRIQPLATTTFASAKVKERSDLQRLLREQIETISQDTLVVAEEFGDWEDSKRRIDLLGLDKDANLVVIELKRTEDGGHMELQALRYAAMISTMTFDQVVGAFGVYLRRLGRSDDPRALILDFLGWDEPDEDHFAQEIRVVLASAEFSRELTTAVLWLNDQGLDIRCVRLRPYRHADHLFLDVQQVIPLPEAADYQVRLREKVQRKKVARQSASGRDYTRYIVTTAQETKEQLPKRKAILEVVKALSAGGVSAADIRSILESKHPYGQWVLCGAKGDLGGEGFVAALTEERKLAGRTFDPVRYFCGGADLLKSGGHTWALTNQWGGNTTGAIDALLQEFPNRGVSCKPVGIEA